MMTKELIDELKEEVSIEKGDGKLEEERGEKLDAKWKT